MQLVVCECLQLVVYEPTRARELWHVWLASTLRKVIKSLLDIIIGKSKDEAAGQTKYIMNDYCPVRLHWAYFGFLRSSILSPAELLTTPLKMYLYFSTPYLSEKSFLILGGETARGETNGDISDVDLLVWCSIQWMKGCDWDVLWMQIKQSSFLRFANVCIYWIMRMITSCTYNLEHKESDKTFESVKHVSTETSVIFS